VRCGADSPPLARPTGGAGCWLDGAETGAARASPKGKRTQRAGRPGSSPVVVEKGGATPWQRRVSARCHGDRPSLWQAKKRRDMERYGHTVSAPKIQPKSHSPEDTHPGTLTRGHSPEDAHPGTLARRDSLEDTRPSHSQTAAGQHLREPDDLTRPTGFDTRLLPRTLSQAWGQPVLAPPPPPPPPPHGAKHGK
jgi:hypothetical protein